MTQGLVGRTLDHYRIDALLGEGGMGAVLKAHDVTLQRDVAIKVMHPQFAQRPNFRERFLQEARTAARMDHPGVVQVYDFGQARSLLYIVMEFIPGSNLRHMLQDLRDTNQWIVLPEAIQLVRQVCLAINYAHQRGVLHRDIKPDNIMLKPEPTEELPYRPVLTDLGLAKLLEGGMMTQEGTSMGTPAYMSPEQAMGEETDARSDVYSLGVLLYELTVGNLPFPIKTLTQAIRYHTKEPPPPPRSVRSDLPQRVEWIILRAMEKNPTDRFPDAGAMADALAETLPAATEAAVAPTAMAGTVSLMTQYQQSLVEQRGTSILGEFAEPPADMHQDSISILAPDGTTHSVPIEAEEMVIGRDPSCNLMLDEQKVSRQHARIQFDGTNYSVTDLDSTNGTYLGTTKLLPGMPETWKPDMALRIGDTWLRLQRTERPTGTVMRSDGTMVSPGLILSSSGPGRVGVFMEESQLSVEPGGSVAVSAIIVNQGPVVDHFQVSITGLPAEWLPVAPPVIRLLPGAQQAVQMPITPPRSPKSRAGRYPMAVRVTSQDAPDQIAEVKATLTVAPYSQFSSELQPQRVRAGKTGQVTVQNRGNMQQTFNLTFQDRADELVFEPPQAQLNVSEGQVAAAEFSLASRRIRWIGGVKTHPFSVHVKSSDDEVQTHEGEAAIRGMIPAWIPPVLIFLCVIAAAAAVLFYSWQSTQDAQATQTAIAALQGAAATQTALALAGESAAQAATATAEALAGANQATIEAATATATWLDGDDDRDGLTNRQELELGTLPSKRDTDEDGLDDNEELNRGTDPLNPDSDGDGLKDGTEVSGGLDPLNPDTDSDGTPDAADEHPGEVPTATPDLGATAQVEASQTAAAQAVLDATAAAIAAGTATAQAQATQAAADAAGATATAQAVATAGVQATATAKAAATATAQAQTMANFVGNWVNTDSNTSGMTRLIIAKVNDTTVSFHGYGKCTPTDCDWGTINVPLASPKLVGTYHLSYKAMRVTVQRSGNQLLAEVFNDYTEADGRTDRTNNYVMKKQLLILPMPTLKIIVTPMIILPTSTP